MYYRTASIMLNAGQRSTTASDIFIAQPDHHKESLAGKLFILIEVESGKSEALKVINFLINNINHNYYQNEKVVLRERIDSLKVEHIFETALAKTNKDLVDFLSREKIKISPYAFNITVAIVHEDNIHFATVGKNKNLLIYQDKSGSSEEGTEYKVTEVSENKERKTKQTSLTKLFSEVTSGRIPNNGYFLLVNEALSEYLSNKQLTEIVTTLPPQGAATQIKNTLSQINAVVTFLGVIIKNTTSPEKVPEPEETEYMENAGGGSLTGLNSTEEETEKILAPSGVISIKDWFKKPVQLISSLISVIQTQKKGKKKKAPLQGVSKAKLLPLKDKVFFKKRRSQFSLSSILPVIKKILTTLLKVAVFLFDWIRKTLADKEKMGKVWKNIKELPHTLRNKAKGNVSWLRRLNKKHKIILGGVILIGVVLIINLSWTGIQNQKEQKQINVSSLVNEIEKNQSEIEANLLYDNEEGARELVQKNKELISQLKEGLGKEEQKKEKYQNIFNKRENILTELRNAIDLEGAEQVTDLRQLNSEADAANISLIGSHIYAGDNEQNTIYHVNTNNDTGTAITGLNGLIASLQHPVQIENSIYYWNSDNILELNTDNEDLSEMNISLPEEVNTVDSMASFRENIYLLSSSNDQIYKYSRGRNSFTGQESWMQEENDLSSAVDLAIDGNIYTLNDDGEVNKYLRGENQDFQLGSITPSIENATRLKISPAMGEGYIYILEPGKNRLAVFNKEGEFLMQYRQDGFTDLRDFAVDEENNTIYILNGTRIYKVEAEHLK